MVITFEQFLTSQSYHVPVTDFIINLILAALLAFVIGYVYIHYGNAFSNRKKFARNFIVITMTTMFIITVVKSSLALSLGLIGALSIVRFRTAIKEPEELSFLFLNIAVGLGLGADQRVITVIAILTVLTIIIIRNKTNRDSKFEQNLYLTVSSSDNEKISLNKIVAILKDNCRSLDLKRYDEKDNEIEISFLVNFDSIEHLEVVRKKINEISNSIRIIFLDYQGAY